MNCSIVLLRKSYYIYGIWIFYLIRRVKLTALKIALKIAPKLSKNSSELVVLYCYVKNNVDLWEDKLFCLEKLAKFHLAEMK